jgi:hypothetical protein
MKVINVLFAARKYRELEEKLLSGEEVTLSPSDASLLALGRERLESTLRGYLHGIENGQGMSKRREGVTPHALYRRQYREKERRELINVIKEYFEDE